ncbi:response regulator transcription factor [Streptomyces sp. NPDC056188]|uniref:response regulator transcription factor n=1 Tax=Streptomyces sp. NPDC056188 TaxID=3345740 RepID=UPI0035D7C9FB
MIATFDLRQHIVAAVDELRLPLTMTSVDRLTAQIAATAAVGHRARKRLSPRLHSILVGIAAGEETPETAARLHLSAHTVKTHRQRLYRALGARNAAHAVAIGMRLGILRPVETGDRL